MGLKPLDRYPWPMDSERKFTMGEFRQAALTSCDELRSRIEEASMHLMKRTFRWYHLKWSKIFFRLIFTTCSCASWILLAELAEYCTKFWKTAGAKPPGRDTKPRQAENCQVTKAYQGWSLLQLPVFSVWNLQVVPVGFFLYVRITPLPLSAPDLVCFEACHDVLWEITASKQSSCRGLLVKANTLWTFV